MDIANIQELMSTPIKVTLTVKVKPRLWHEVTSCLGKMGVLVPKLKPIHMPKKMVGKVECDPIPINKVRDYCEGEDNNTIPPMEFNEIKSMVIQDSGAGVAIATKDAWDAWGNLALRKIRMKL